MNPIKWKLTLTYYFENISPARPPEGPHGPARVPQPYLGSVGTRGELQGSAQLLLSSEIDETEDRSDDFFGFAMGALLRAHSKAPIVNPKKSADQSSN